MSALTTRLQLYKPGGGLSGLITPDEIADIDRINSDLDLIDANMGFRNVTSGTRPLSPYDGEPIYETDTTRLRIWNNAAGQWLAPGAERGGSTDYSIADLSALAGITDPQPGDFVNVRSAIGWTYMRNQANSAWVQVTPGVFSSAASRDGAQGYGAGPGAVAGNTCIRSDLNNALFVFTGATWQGALALTPLKPATVTPTGGAATINGNGSVTVTGACTNVAIDGVFTGDFDDYEVHIKGTGSATADIVMRLRNAGADLASGYQWGNADASFAATVTAGGSASDTRVTLARINAASAPVWCKAVLASPFLAAAKVFNWNSTATDRARFGGGMNLSTLVCSGMSIAPNAGNFQVVIKVFGISNVG